MEVIRSGQSGFADKLNMWKKELQIFSRFLLQIKSIQLPDEEDILFIRVYHISNQSTQAEKPGPYQGPSKSHLQLYFFHLLIIPFAMPSLNKPYIFPIYRLCSSYTKSDYFVWPSLTDSN